MVRRAFKAFAWAIGGIELLMLIDSVHLHKVHLKERWRKFRQT